MERLTYILDTNAVADYINQFEPTTNRIKQAIRTKYLVYICQPVYYEVLRGLLKTNAMRKQRIFEEQFVPQLLRISLTDQDWQQAAQFWADTSRAGRQLADTDLLIAAVAKRMGGIVITADDDFDALPIQRENWRLPVDMHSIEYVETTNILEVEFHNGGKYRYSGVPSSVYQELVNAESQDVYFHSNIKDRYPHTKIG